jgi:hypothetical protein
VPNRLTSLLAADLIGFFVEGPQPVDARVVDHHGNEAVALLGRVQEGSEHIGTPDVQSQADRARADLGSGRLRRLLIEITDRDAGARAGEVLGDRAADALGTAGHRDRHVGK